MLAHISDLKRKLRTFDIHPKFDEEFRALIEDGTPPSHELGVRLSSVANYKACLDSLLAELSQPVIQQHFPPSVDHFESLNLALDLALDLASEIT